MIILPSVYAGTIHYFSELLSGQEVTIDLGENYCKQSCRTRCDLLLAEGVCSLVIPVLKPSGRKIPMREVRIDYTKQWQSAHWNSLRSGYANSPYFNELQWDFRPFFKERIESLVEFNCAFQQAILTLLNVSPTIHYAEQYCEASSVDRDLRSSIARKRGTETLVSTPRYYQVFSDRWGFHGGLSVLDALFCEGPDETLALIESFSAHNHVGSHRDQAERCDDLLNRNHI